MTGPTALLLAMALAAEGRIDTGLRVEALGRRVDPASPAYAHAIDLTVAPHLGLEVRGGGRSANLRYSPTFTAADVGPDRRTAVVHAGEARLAIAPHPVLRLELLGTAEAGASSEVISTPFSSMRMRGTSSEE